jgi:hypothetical protein
MIREEPPIANNQSKSQVHVSLFLPPAERRSAPTISNFSASRGRRGESAGFKSASGFKGKHTGHHASCQASSLTA